jgi:4-hydroxybenzoate polyprenyltransferase
MLPAADCRLSADEAHIGVKSSALALGKRTRPWLMGVYAGASAFWLLAGLTRGAGAEFAVMMLALAAVLIQQARRLATDDTAACKRHFLRHALWGAALFASFLAV